MVIRFRETSIDFKESILHKQSYILLPLPNILITIKIMCTFLIKKKLVKLKFVQMNNVFFKNVNLFEKSINYFDY
jgi:hypothetical protein